MSRVPFGELFAVVFLLTTMYDTAQHSCIPSLIPNVTSPPDMGTPESLSPEHRCDDDEEIGP
ncbi:hypothetical protein RRF57_009295 [Xylaria bambusicola]|uniref:Uncharacterized protein n=1 Tax=Xylaria bambusicola TaxID=326684 RepID=A0AAN7UWL2_9PEZI